MLDITIIPALKDNYIYLLRDTESEKTAVIDPSEAKPVLSILKERQWTLDYVLNTHHHWDHTGGNLALKKATGCTIVGFEGDTERIPGIDEKLVDKSYFHLGQSKAQIFFIPGHTLGHIAYWFVDDKALFSGDTLFSLGCGRLFEGTAEQMYHSLQTLAALPDDTRVYCGHEYTVANGNFALMLEPHNTTLQAYYAQANQLRKQGKPTIPSTMALERAANPFLRPESSEIRQYLHLENHDPITVFAAIRQQKDHF